MKNYYSTVRQILLENPATRDDDMLLFGAFMAKYNLISYDKTFFDVMANAKKWGLPSYESITRARRKVQEQEPLLQGKRRKQRMEEESIYHDYYRNH